MKHDELITALEEYVELLSDEITELAGLASVHGWKSSRYKQGVKCREKILKLKILIYYEET